MNIYKNISEIPNISVSRGVIIGNFDGIHLGHRAHISNFMQKCNKENCEALLITLDPHPLIFFKGRDSNVLINSKQKKIDLLKELGIENCLSLPFDEELQKLSAREFIENYILKIKGLSFIYLGHDFKIGNGKENATELIKKISADKKIEVHQSSAFLVNDTICSSTKIREFLSSGDIKNANEFLGRKYSLKGEVIRGDGVGRAEIVATANLKVQDNLLIPNAGVYFTNTLFEGNIYKSITNIGTRPTLGFNNNVSVETHILGFNRDIYTKDIEVSFISKLRNEKKFNSIKELKSQIVLDIDKRRQYDD